jgi:uncharacterized protein YjbI with pentapeptide repeats
MDHLVIRDTRAALPSLDDVPLDDLGDVGGLEGAPVVLSEFHVADGAPRSLELVDRRLDTGRISGLKVEYAVFDDLRVEAVDFARCDLSQAVFRGGRWTRVRFSDCKILSGRFDGVALENVVFDRCKLDYTVFRDVTAKGPVVFLDCSLEESWFAGCDLGKAAFDECRMRLTSFERSSCQGLDLRGNDLSEIRGIGTLAGTVVDPVQTVQLGRALVGDVGLRLTDD